MSKLTRALLATALFTWAGAAQAQNVFPTPAGPTTVGVVTMCINPSGNAIPCGSVGYDSGAVAATATPANASHAAGVSVGGLLTVPLARLAGGSGILTGLIWKSTGGSTGQLVLRVWQAQPTHTTCTDNVAFVGSDTDDANLIAGPVSITPAAPSVTTGDTATYASLANLTWDYKNADTTASPNIYVCALTVGTDTADQNKQIRLTLSGPQN